MPSLPPGFTHLSVHSQFTLLGATPTVAELAARAAQDGFTHLALTDRNVLYGAVAFARACRDAGVQPIVGMTLALAPFDSSDTLANNADVPSAGELTLLAMNPAGYRSLCRLSSLLQAPAAGAESRTFLDWETLKANADGLLCLSGGRRGWVNHHLRRGDPGAAARVVGRLAGLFGERACLALELHGPEDAALAREITALAARFGLATAAVQPVYCLHPADRAQLRLLAAIARNERVTDVPSAALPDGGDAHVDLHWLSPAEMTARFARFPAALAQVGELAARCGPALPDGRPIWPVLPLRAGQNPDDALAEQARAGLAERYAAGAAEDGTHRRRLDAELAAIASREYAPLFLVVADIVRYARQQAIPVSTRGSVANSLVAYCVGITTVDPIAHNLLFERFLNPARSGLPDIDLDFCSVRRDEVLEYVRARYGRDRVALVATVSTFRLRSALRAVAKAYALDDATTERLVRLLPEDWHPDPQRRARQTLDDALAKVQDAHLHPVVRAAFSLLRVPDHLSIHPGGVVVTPGPLTDVVPVQLAPKGFLITQFDSADVEALGLPKIDLLGIRALTVMADAAALVRRWYAPGFRLEDIPLDDVRTGELLARGETIGVFQCESAGAQRTLRQLKAHAVADLAVANAFFKPGPALGGMAQHFVLRYRGEEPVSYLHPSLGDILGPTMGVLIFQEQILRLAREIAGLSWEEADRLRKGMSKFHADEMQAIRERFVRGCQRPAPEGPGLTEAQARTLWEQVEPFAGYGFNQGHATAYADVSYRSAYLKAHWPAAFLCGRLANWGGYHYASTYIAEARRLGIAVRPPHVNFSGAEFALVFEVAAGSDRGDRSDRLVRSDRSVESDTPETHHAARRPVLYMGLNQVRDLRQQAIRAVIDEHERRPFAGLDDLLARVALQAKEVTHLIQCGALDGLGPHRAGLLAEAAQALRAGAGQFSFDFLHSAAAPETPAERLAWERALLGQPVSVHPLDVVAGLPQDVLPLAAASKRPGLRVRAAGVRLPGWTGGKGFFLADRTDYLTAVLPRGLATPAPWEPVLVAGRWQVDPWGGGWLQVEALERLSFDTARSVD